MKMILKVYLEFMDFIDDIVQNVCIILGAAMTVSVLIQVFSRWLPVSTPAWTEELARYLMICMAFLGASCGIKRWNNISVDFIIVRLSQKAQFFLNIIIKIVVLMLILFFCYLSITVFPKVGLRQYSATLGIPMIIPQSSLIIGFSLMILQMIGTLSNDIIGGGDRNA